MQLLTLQAKKVKATEHGYTGFKTEFYKNGKLFATIPLGSTQPRRGQKTYTLNSWNWALEWMPETKVSFYIEPEGGQILAYFPDEIHNKELRTCYVHIGQHSGCHPDYLKKCRKAKPEQYAALLEELVSIGYDNLIVK